MLVIVYAAEIIFDEISLMDFQSDLSKRKLKYIKKNLGIQILNNSKNSCIIVVGSKMKSIKCLKGYFWKKGFKPYELFNES